MQPWHVHVLAGEPLAALKRGIAARPDELPFGEGADGRLGLIGPRIMRSPASVSKISADDAEKILQCQPR